MDKCDFIDIDLPNSKRRKLNPEVPDESLQITPLERRNDSSTNSNQTHYPPILGMLDMKLFFRTIFSNPSLTQSSIEKVINERISEDKDDEYHRLYIINQAEFYDYKRCNLTNGNDKSYFNNLPAEIIIYIFKYLQQDAIAQCSMVSKHFNAITNNSCLWKCWHLHKFTMTEKIFQKLFYFKTERVSISYAQIPVDFSLTKVEIPLNEMLSIIELDLTTCNLNINDLICILSYCRELRCLSLECTAINNDVVRQIIYNQNLEVLNLCMCNGLTSYGTFLIGTSIPRLKYLNVSWTSMKFDQILMLSTFLPETLKSINLAGYWEILDDIVIERIVMNCPKLEKLDISESRITSAGIRILSQLEHLEYLAISRCGQLTLESFIYIEAFLSLKCLDMFTFPDELINSIRTKYPNLIINRDWRSRIARPTAYFSQNSFSLLWND